MERARTRTISWVVNDGSLNSAAGTTSTINITNRSSPVIAVPGAQTLGAGQAASIAGVSLSEAGNAGGETFT